MARHQALRGAKELISQARPTFIIEWNDKNLGAYGVKAEELLSLGEEMSYKLYACPNLIPVGTRALLRMAMTQTETFILVPPESRGIGYQPVLTSRAC